QRDELVAANVSVLRHRTFFDDFDAEIMTEPSDEKHTLSDPFGPQVVIDVGAIHHNDRATLDRQQMCRLDIAVKGAGEVDKPRHIVVMVQKDVGLHTAFDFFKLRPRKQRQAQGNGCRIQQEQLVLKTKWLLTWPQQVNPRACLSALVALTKAPNSVRGK